MATIEGSSEFWKGLSFEEFKGICDRDGLLTRAQSVRAWQMAGQRGPPPPGRFRILLNDEDVQRVLREWAARRRPN